jgi:beta-glucosidase
MAPGINYTYGTAAESEITVAVLGNDPSLEGEEGDAVASPGGGDRERIELPEVQRTFLLELRKHARKLIVVLTGGGAIAVPEAQEIADAVLQVWYPGCEGGLAVADVLFGDVMPSGRLPVTVPFRTEDLPPFERYDMAGRTYRFAGKTPLYPFGFGLSYSTFSYDALRLAQTSLGAGEALGFTTAVTNTGTREAAEVVQCYLRPPAGFPHAPRATLVAFRKVNVPAGGTVTLDFTLPAAAFDQVDADGERVRVPGEYELVVGPACPDPRAQELGAPAPATARVVLR